MNDRPVQMAEFEAAVSVIGETTPELPVLLIADEEVALKHLTRVMDILRSQQLNKIRLQSR